MNAKACLAAAVLLVVSSSVAGSAVISRDWKAPGDGLLTYDTVSGREWLDFSPQLTLPEPRYDAVLAELGPGGMFEGFEVASVDDVFDLATSAGVMTDTSDFAVNGEPLLRLIDLIASIDHQQDIFRAMGLTSEVNANSLRVFVYMRHWERNSLDKRAELLVQSRFDRFDPNALPVHILPVYLYRATVPEPATLLYVSVLLTLSVLGIGLRRSLID